MCLSDGNKCWTLLTLTKYRYVCALSDIRGFSNGLMIWFDNAYSKQFRREIIHKIIVKVALGVYNNM